MREHLRSAIPGVLVAVGTTAAAVLVRTALAPWLGHDAPLMLLVVAVAVSSAYGGLRAGLLATALGFLVGDYLFVRPTGSLLVTGTSDQLRLVLFVLVSLTISLVSEARHRSHRRAEAQKQALETEVVERQHAETALRESEQRFARFMQHLPGLAWIKNLEGRYAFANDAAVNAFRKPRHELYGKTDEDLFPPETARQFQEHDRQALDSESGIQAVETLEQPDGVTHHSLVSKFPIPAADGRPAMVGGMAIDVTDRKQAEERLRESEERYRILIEVSPQVVWTCDPNGNCTYCNQVFLDFTGRPIDELLGDRWTALVHPDHRARVREAWFAAVRDGERYEVEIPFRRGSDGAYRWFLARGIPNRDDEGRIVRWSGTAIDITDRKRAEEALQESEDLSRRRLAELQTIYASAPIGLGFVNRDLRYISINRALAELDGLPAEQIVGRTLREVLTPEVADRVEPLYLRVIETGQPIDGVEVHGSTRAGGPRDFLVNYHPVKAADGTVLGVNSSVQDITDRKQAEERLRQSHARFEALLNAAPLGVYLVDADFRMREVNPTALPVFGDIPDLIGRDFDEVLHILWTKEYADEVVRLFRHTLETGEPYMTPERIERRLDRGVTEYYEWRIDRIPLPDGRFGVVCYFRDISGQVQARAAIAESEKRLRFVLDSMPQKVFTANPNGDVDYFNPQWMEFTGLSFEQIRDWGWRQFVHPDDVEENVRVWRHSIDTGEPFQFEQRFRRADGEYRWHLSRALPMRDEAGQIIMWIGSNTDIHDVKLAQEALQEADRRKDEFLATLAHELRNPLAPIRSGLELLRLAGDDRELLDEVRDTMEGQVLQMVRLIDDLLDVSRITRGKLELRRGRVELAAVVQSALESVRPLIDEAGHELTVSLPDEPVVLHVDAARLSQVLSNLLGNAAKYTPPGGRISLTAKCGNEEDCSSHSALRTPHSAFLTVAIRDSGIGIPPEMLERIFEMFTQVDHSLERAHSGLGIGLTLVKQLVEMHGGTVEAHSDGPQQGTEFVIRLPLIVSPEPGPTDATGNGRPTGDAPRRRILVVDDNRDAARNLGRSLELLGHSVRTAFDGLQGVDAAEEFRPDVVLLDLGMPRLNGLDAARRIRERDWGRKITLIALTGWGQEEDKQRTRDAGFDHHLIKPVEPAALHELLRCESGERRASAR